MGLSLGATPVRAILASSLSVFGVLTLTASAKAAIEGPAAFGIFLLVAGPLAVAALCYSSRSSIAKGSLLAVGLGVLAVLGLTMAVGAVSGSTFAADLALGATLTTCGVLLGTRALILCGAVIVGTTLALLLLGAPEATVPVATGTALLVSGVALRGGLRGPRQAVSAATPAGQGFRMEELARSYERQAALLCAAAFYEDPAMRAVVPGHLTRARVLESWFAGLFRIARRYAKQPIVGGFFDRDLAAVRVVYESGTYPAPAWSMILVAGLPLRGGPLVAWRALRWLIVRERNHPEEPHLYLETLATAVAHQGRGAATALMQDLCRRADERGLPIILHTNSTTNVAYYRRFGFVVSGEVMLPVKAEEWTLRRAPRDAGVESPRLGR